MPTTETTRPPHRSKELVEQWRAEELETGRLPGRRPQSNSRPGARRRPSTAPPSCSRNGCTPELRAPDPASKPNRGESGSPAANQVRTCAEPDSVSAEPDSWCSGCRRPRENSRTWLKKQTRFGSGFDRFRVVPAPSRSPSPAHRRGPYRAAPAATCNGLTLLVAILACIWLTGRRWTAMGGDWGTSSRARRPSGGVGFGVLGGTLSYHDITSWRRSPPTRSGRASGRSGRAASGIWGGILFGALAGAVRESAARVRAFRCSSTPPRPGLLLAPGHRPDRQLVEPGALRASRRRSPGASRSRPTIGPLAYFQNATFPPDFFSMS